MLAITPPEDAYELHINLIRHGRAICRPRPRCRECGLRRMCPWYREHKAEVLGNMLPRAVKRSTFVMFGIVVLLFAVLVPAWAMTEEGSQDASPDNVPADLEDGKELFVTNCGACHTLARPAPTASSGRTSTTCSPRRAPAPPDPNTIKPRVLSAIKNGVNGRMPKGILTGPQADQVATFVAQVAGQGPSPYGTAQSPATLPTTGDYIAMRGIRGRHVPRRALERSAVE